MFVLWSILMGLTIQQVCASGLVNEILVFYESPASKYWNFWLGKKCPKACSENIKKNAGVEALKCVVHL